MERWVEDEGGHEWPEAGASRRPGQGAEQRPPVVPGTVGVEGIGQVVGHPERVDAGSVEPLRPVEDVADGPVLTEEHPEGRHGGDATAADARPVRSGSCGHPGPGVTFGFHGRGAPARRPGARVREVPVSDQTRPLSMAEADRVPAAQPYRDDAPNVVVIVLDDLGFAHLGAYGSDLETPNLDRLAGRGLRFTNFHTTAVCSPTRSCLLTGRNHHRVGMGMLPDLPTNFPGYASHFPRSAGTLAQILRADGYATFCVGKWHLVPRDERDTGPYGMWPTSLGFDRYYGFLNGETNQWTPNLVRDTNHVEPPRTPEEGYHLEADLADNAIAYLRELRRSHPERPFFLWYGSGAPHAPHQAPPEWIERFRGRFDAGWDAWREATHRRQLETGILAEGTPLSPRPPWVEEWSTIDGPRRRLYARMMEVFAAFVAHADHQIGRVLDHLESTGELDRTVVICVSDNGASAEGGPNGTYNQLGHYISDEPDDLEDELAHIDDLGGFASCGHYPWGWALAGNTPFRRWKRYTFEGGVRDPFLIAGPGIDDAGSARDQYCHATDVLPTVLELCGLELPVRGRRCRADELRRLHPGPHGPGPGRPRPPSAPVLRVLGEPGHLPRRLEGRDQPREPADGGRA